MSQLTAPNQTIEATNGVTYAYRRFGGRDNAALPVVFFQHFRGNLDNWDPALVDAIGGTARSHPVRQCRRRRVDRHRAGPRSQRWPSTRLQFIDALGLQQIDVFGFSIGGYVAQELTLIRPRLVRRVVLAGTAPQGGERIHGFDDDVYGNAVPDEPAGDDLLALFFERTDTSVAKGLGVRRRESSHAPTTATSSPR